MLTFGVYYCVVYLASILLGQVLYKDKLWYGFDMVNDVTIIDLAETGSVRGKVLKNEKGEDFLTFRGIPYAIPPLGPLRFKKPVEADRWRGIMNATSYRNVCLQADPKDPSIILGNEDCLYLNVFSPIVKKFKLVDDKIELKPVMVYLHGGCLLYGAGSFHNPIRLLSESIILVTLNYRLGAFGFFSTGDKVAPGNYGFYDQLLALQWVNRHINKFGGDPARVTLFGCSAGAASVTAHLISPLSKDLFYAAIIQSGTLMSDRFLEHKPLFQARRLARLLDCPECPTAVLVHCLRLAPADSIVMATTIIRESGELNAVFPFRPVIDKQCGFPAFIPEHPKLLFSQGKFNHVPVLSGVVKDEGAYYYMMFGHESKCAVTMEQAFNLKIYETVMPLFAQEFFLDEFVGYDFLKEINWEYLPICCNATLKDYMLSIFEVLSDASVTSYMDITNELLASNVPCGVPVYAYKVTYPGLENSLKDHPAYRFIPNDTQIVPHGDELQHLFYRGVKGNNTEKNCIMHKLMVHLWVSFATNRIPALPVEFVRPENLAIRPLFNNSITDYSYLDINPTPVVLDEFWFHRERNQTGFFSQFEDDKYFLFKEC